MKFLLDHDVPLDISYSLFELGHEVVRLPEVLDPSARDEQVLEYASRNGCVLSVAIATTSCTWHTGSHIAD